MSVMTVDSDVFCRELEIEDVFPGATPADWRQKAVESLGGKPFEVLRSTTHEGVDVEPLYTADGGLEPWGIGPAASPGWRCCQRYRHPDASAVAGRMAEDGRRGIDMAWIVFDRSVRLGLEADDPARLTGAPDGVLAVTIDQLEPLLGSLDPSTTALQLGGGGAAPTIAAAVLAAARARGLASGDLELRLDVDPLAALVSDGELPYGLDRSLALLADIAAWTSRNAPPSRSVAASTLPYHLAGAHAAQELAFGLATAVEYLRRMTAGGVDLEDAAGQLRFVFAVGRDLFVEAAKLRAARMLWARVLAACGSPASAARTEIHAVTSPRCLAAVDPWVNLLRATTQSFAAVVGGADAITALPFDGATGPSDELGRRLSANSHAILREESHLHRVGDPAAGSWYVERLTGQLAEGAWSRFQQIEALGGMADAITSGVIHRELEEAAASRRRAIATRRDPVTGVSTFPNLDERPIARMAPDVRELRRSLREILADRLAPSAELDRLRRVAAAGTHDGAAIEAAVDAFGAGATTSEVTGALRGDGQATGCDPLPQEREGEIFERLRAAGDAWLAESGRRPRAYLAAVGPPAEHRAIREFVVNLLAVGGIEAVEPAGGDDWDAVISGFEGSGTHTAVIAVHPKHAEEAVPTLVRSLKARGALRVLVASPPGESEGAWRAAGVDGFLCEGCDVHQALQGLLAAAGWLP